MSRDEQGCAGHEQGMSRAGAGHEQGRSRDGQGMRAEACVRNLIVVSGFSAGFLCPCDALRTDDALRTTKRPT